MNAKQLWQAALERVRANVSPASYTTWFKATEGVELRTDELVVQVPNSFAAEHLRQRFSDVAALAAAEALGHAVGVAFVVRAPRRTDATADDAGDRAGESAPPAHSSVLAPAHSSAPMSSAGRGRAPTAVGARSARHERRAVLDAPHMPGTRSPMSATALTPMQPPLLPSADNWRASQGRSIGQVSARNARDVAGTHNTTAVDATKHWRDPSQVDAGGRLMFDTFVVGTANRLAYAAAQQITTTPGEAYNPLFIYGGTGLGKTHLLLAIGHQARHHGLRVCYVPAERFANDIIEAIRHHTTDDFRARYRHVDVLLVDDVQFIAGKESTEEEFFHTFNTLHDANRQIVLSSDRTPKAMHHLHDRLRSRFEWGLIADIQPPDSEHRLNILRAKAAALGVALGENVLAAIARPECASVRELEGALNRVLAYAAMLGKPADEDIVARALGPLRAAEPREMTPEHILRVVARHYTVSVEALRGKARDHTVAWPRQVAMYLLREETPASLCQIGQHLGGRDHTTVMHGCAHVGRELAAKGNIRHEVDALRAELRH